jgi:hypothetical protein
MLKNPKLLAWLNFKVEPATRAAVENLARREGIPLSEAARILVTLGIEQARVIN